jgi:hypothetical protein
MIEYILTQMLGPQLAAARGTQTAAFATTASALIMPVAFHPLFDLSTMF